MVEIIDIGDSRARTNPWLYVQHLIHALSASPARWVFWNPWYRDPSNRQVDSLDATCIIAGPPKDAACSWHEYLARGQAHPCVWHRETLLAQLQSLRYVAPDVDFLPFQLALGQNSLHIHASRPLATPGLRRWTQEGFAHMLHNARPQHLVPATDRPLITIVICAYNEVARLGWAVQSVMHQTLSSWQLLIVDDGSTDLTPQWLHGVDDPRIAVITHAGNRGKTCALNTALANADGSWLLELDSDDWLTPDACAVLTDPTMTTASHMVLRTGAYHLWSAGMRGHLTYKSCQPTVVPRITPHDAVVPIPRCYQTADLRVLGGWPTIGTDHDRYFEDVAQTARYLTEGHIVSSTSRPLYHRVIHADSISQRANANYHTWWQMWQTAR